MTNFKLVQLTNSNWSNEYRIGRNNQYLIVYVKLTNSSIGDNYQFKLVTTNKSFNQFVFTVYK